MSTDETLDAGMYTTQLKQWVKEVLDGKRWEYFDDLHLDSLGAQFQHPGRWIEGSLLLLGALENLYDPQQYQVLLIIRLATTTTPTTGQNLYRLPLEREVDTTPPSFYLFPQPSPVVTATVQGATYLPSLSQQLQRQVYYQERLDEGEYDRSLVVLVVAPD